MTQITKLRAGSYYKNESLGFSLILAETAKTHFAPLPSCDACGEQTKYMLLCWGDFNEGRYVPRCTSCVPAESLEKASYRFA
jgi:hypothetical protein